MIVLYIVLGILTIWHSSTVSELEIIFFLMFMTMCFKLIKNSKHLLVSLLIFEQLMLLTLIILSMLKFNLMLPNTLIFTFLIMTVCEAVLAIACVLRANRSYKPHFLSMIF